MKKAFTGVGTGNYWEVVVRQRKEYLQRPSLQAIYEHWADCMRKHLSSINGKFVELGCGCGALSSYFPEVIKTDIYKHDWVDEVVDACSMPYDDEECSNLIAVDMLHHLPYVPDFFDEVKRTLKPGGRLILLEPYISPFSYLIYNFFHHEPVDMSVNPFDVVSITDDESGDPCNEALPTLIFKQCREQYTKRWPELNIVNIELRDWLVYPLTGGFSKRQWVSGNSVIPMLKIEDFILKLTGKLLAMNMLVVIEKRS